ncbi:hypothetical protein [Sphingomonas bacterium]|uniref:hypothetical protein n=1 Tax=Sphingomonas bacterium TaxID=1895847 RepID=UPI0015750E66|nr:hypothetical protein [Sphingomonas bacterium]
MATTLPLLDITKTDSRKDGAISWARVRVLLDGVERGADFRARLGEEPVVIDGDTITVSDAQIDAIRVGDAWHAADMAKRAAQDAGKLDAEIAKLDAFLTARNASPAAAEELRGFIRANADLAISLHATGCNPRAERFVAERRSMMIRHGLIAG